MTRREQPSEYHPWTTYIRAVSEARRRGDRTVGTEHLLLGLLSEPGLADVLGVDLASARDALEALDREALEVIGIEGGLEAPPIPVGTHPPRRPTLRNVIGQRLRLTPAAANVLRSSGRPVRRGRSVDPRAVLIALLELDRPDPAAFLFAALGVDRASVRAQLFGRDAA